jgi:hypothetical protein
MVLLFALFILGGFATAADLEFAALQRRIEEIEPRPEEKRFDEIGWAKDLREARRLSAEHDRPVFLFTHDGRMNIGRC